MQKRPLWLSPNDVCYSPISAGILGFVGMVFLDDHLMLCAFRIERMTAHPSMVATWIHQDTYFFV